MIAIISLFTHLFFYEVTYVTIIDPCDEITNVEQAIGCSTVNRARVFHEYR